MNKEVSKEINRFITHSEALYFGLSKEEKNKRIEDSLFLPSYKTLFIENNIKTLNDVLLLKEDGLERIFAGKVRKYHTLNKTLVSYILKYCKNQKRFEHKTKHYLCEAYKTLENANEVALEKKFNHNIDPNKRLITIFKSLNIETYKDLLNFDAFTLFSYKDFGEGVAHSIYKIVSVDVNGSSGDVLEGFITNIVNKCKSFDLNLDEIDKFEQYEKDLYGYLRKYSEDHYSDKEITVLNKRLLLIDPYTLKEVGDEFNCSREAIRQKENNIKIRLVSDLLNPCNLGNASIKGFYNYFESIEKIGSFVSYEAHKASFIFLFLSSLATLNNLELNIKDIRLPLIQSGKVYLLDNLSLTENINIMPFPYEFKLIILVLLKLDEIGKPIDSFTIKEIFAGKRLFANKWGIDFRSYKPYQANIKGIFKSLTRLKFMKMDKKGIYSLKIENIKSTNVIKRIEIALDYKVAS